MRLRIGFLADTREVASADVHADTTLLEVLRGSLGLKSVVRGCKNGTCGSCRVLLDGELVSSCTILASDVRELAHIETYEHLSEEGAAQTAVEHFRNQRNSRCSLCVAGLGVAAVHLSRTGVAGDEGAIDKALQGAHCQCTGRGSLRRALAFVRHAPAVSGKSGS